MIIINRKIQTDENIAELKEIEPKSWIDLIKPTNEEIRYTLERTGVLREHLVSALDENERPRFDIEDNGVLIIVRVPYEFQKQSHFTVKTVPIGIIIKDNCIITVRSFETNVINDFHENKIKGFYTSKRTRFLIQILSRTNYYFLKYLDMIEDEIERIEKKLVKSLNNKDIFELFELQKILTYFNSSITANGHLLEQVSKGRIVKLYKEDEDLLEDIIVENRQCLDMVTNYIHILSNTLDAYASVISNNLNDVMKFLASLTIILSIPAIISSIYGMNVKLPLQNNPLAFVWTMLISLFLIIIVARLFVERRWL